MTRKKQFIQILGMSMVIVISSETIVNAEKYSDRNSLELAQAEQRLNIAISNQNIARRQLAETLSIAHNSDLATADAIEKAGTWSRSLHESIIQAFKNRAELEQFLLQREIGDKRRKIALSQVRATLSASASYGVNDDFEDDFDISDQYSVGLNLQWLLFDGGAARAGARQAEKDIAIAETQFANQRNQIRFAVEQAYFGLESNQKNIGRNYLKSISLTFFETHLRNNPDYRSFLTAAYGQNISNPKLPLHLIQSLDPQQLESAYGAIPPTSPIPEMLVGQKPEQNRNILAEIEQTGILKVAIASDAAPFGYKDKNNDLTGYCVDFADTLGDRLTKKSNRSKPIKVEKISSSSSNQFELIKAEKAHLECGPNSIGQNREGVIFSDPFFSSGTRFLINNNAVSPLDLDSSLEGAKLGVLETTTAEKFLKQNYPDAEIVAFNQENAKARGIQAVKNGDINAFVNDSVLLTGAIDNRGISRANYQTIPKNPLTCDYYGLILPQGDSRWLNTVNNFIRDRSSKTAFNQWLGRYYDQAVADLDYCQNRREQ